MSLLNSQYEPLTAVENMWKSLYIPVLPKDMLLDNKSLFDEDSLTEFFEKKQEIGKVSRIDYVNKKMPNGIDKVSAFVHFEYIYGMNEGFVNYMNEHDEFKVTGYYDYGMNGLNETFKIIRSATNPNITRYFSVKINKTPIPEITIPEENIHQLVANNKMMEKVIEEQKQQIEALQADILALKTLALKNLLSNSIDEYKNNDILTDDIVMNENSIQVDALQKRYLRETSLMY